MVLSVSDIKEKLSVPSLIHIRFLTCIMMNDMFNSSLPEPKKVGVWTEGKATRIEPKEFVIPKRSPNSSDDIPTIPDLDDLQDILDQEISMPPIDEHKDVETVNVLAEVGGGIIGSADGIEAAIELLLSFLPQVEADSADTVWTIDSLLAQLSDEDYGIEI